VHATRSSEAERFMREAEILREKNVSLSVEFDLVQKKQAESRRRAEELSAMHSSDSARLAEMMARLVAQEAESTRLQKLNDALEMKLIETGEAATRVASELMERDKRHQSENQALRSEIQMLNSRLQNAANEQRGAETGLTEMRSRMDDLESERHVLERKLAMLAGEGEDEGLAQAQLVAPEAVQPSELEEDRQRTEEMREQIAELQATVERLKQYERLYATAKARGKGKSEVASGFTVEGGQIVPEFANEKQAARA
jgi:chromosome segregation ATPase